MMQHKIEKDMNNYKSLQPDKKESETMSSENNKPLSGYKKKNNPGAWFVPAVLIGCFVVSFLGFAAGVLVFDRSLFSEKLDFIPPESTFQQPGAGQEDEETELSALSYEEAVIAAVERVSPSVVSIVITKNVPILEEYYYNPFEELERYFGEEFDIEVPQYREKGSEEQEIGGGTGFIVSSDGLILTNKHVVSDEQAGYTVFTNEGQKYEAQVLARDPFQDIAILKIEAEGLPVVELGDSSDLKIGQTVIAIGNVLGEFRNSVSRGVVSGLSRSVLASGGGRTELLEDIIQTDAAINRGNSGGPLLNLKGEVVGINTAMAVTAENVSFAIPIDHAKRGLEQVKESGEIVYPFLGIHYTMITPPLAEEFDLSIEDGAWVGRNQLGQTIDNPIFPGSPAEEVGLRQDDIILEFDGRQLSQQNSLAKVIRQYSPGDTVALKVLRDGQEITLRPTLDRFEQ